MIISLVAEEERYHSKEKEICSRLTVCPLAMFTLYMFISITTFSNRWNTVATLFISKQFPRKVDDVYFSSNAIFEILGIGNYAIKLHCGGKLLLIDTLLY